MMIIESESNNIVLETLIDESKAPVISGIERMHIITYSMCRDILNSIKNTDEDLARSVVSLEDDVDQLMFFLLRLIRSAAMSPSLANQLGLDPLDCLDFQTLVHRIERIGDHATNIAINFIDLIEIKKEIPENVTSILLKAAEGAITHYDMSVQSFLSKDITTTNEIIDKEKEIDELLKKITSLTHRGESCDLSNIHNIISIMESVKKISHHASDIAELTIDRTYKS
jgi:phosphate uptake regulator